MLEKEEIVSPALEDLKSHYRSIITLLGEDAEREGLLKTPERVAKAMLSLTKAITWILMKYCVRLSLRRNIARW